MPMIRLSLASFAALSLVALSGCGQTTGDRALSGGAIGAGAGLAGGSMLGGAVIGGAAGAATGALTSPNDVNLGRPAWRR